jgi:hypothetical protein
MSAAVASLTAVAEVAFRGGLAAGIRSVFHPSRPVPCAAGGHTLLPVGCAAQVERWRLPAGTICGGDAAVSVLAHPAAAAEDLELLRIAGPVQVARSVHVSRSPEPAYALPLVAVRLGVTRRMLGLAAAHLGGRRSEGAPLTARQLVQAAIADVATAIEACHHGLRVAGTDPAAATAAAAWMHTRLDRADRTVSEMFGAAGYLRDHPVRSLHVVALVREVWAPPALWELWTPPASGESERGL